MSGLQQLMDMGLSRVRATAALERSKGDVMRAAEIVWSGDLDHLEETDEPVASAATSGRSSLPTPECEGDESDGGPMPVDDEDDASGDDDEPMEDDEEEEEDYDAFDDEDEDDAFIQGGSENGGAQAAHDPYSGVFFSKDRREELVEVEETPERFKLAVAGREETGEVCTFGEWMSGCPEKGEQEFLFNLWRDLTENALTCSCGHTWTRRKSDFFPIFTSFETYLSHISSIVQKSCPGCSRVVCFSCGEDAVGHAHESDGNGNGKARSSLGGLAMSDPKTDKLYHCPSLQGVLLGVGLIMVSRVFCELFGVQSYQTVAKVSASDLASPRPKKRKVESTATPHGKVGKKTSGHDGDDDDEAYGYAAPSGVKAKGGTGYSGNALEDRSGQKAAMQAQLARDRQLSALLSAVRAFLPNMQRAGGGKTSDYLVHPTTLASVRRRFDLVSSTLLRNDSLSDMSDRDSLYLELFAWLESLSNHEALCGALAMPTMTRVSVTANPSSSGKAAERTVVYEGSPSPRELLESLVLQATAAQKGFEATSVAKAVQEVEPDEMTEEMKRRGGKDAAPSVPLDSLDEMPAKENVALLAFCERIIKTALTIDKSLSEQKGTAFVKRLHDSLPKISSSSSTAIEAAALAATDSEETIRKVYEEWAAKVRFEYCDLSIQPASSDSPITYKHAHSKDAVALTGTSLPKRSMAIAKELAVLTMNLPVGFDGSVFLRVDETRVDVIKALIIGPADTPYANGCFIFDIFLPLSYNNTPPLVKTMTTKGGTQRLNPNLYADGKVCLSLLGTWQGPGWVAGSSTLLQVLVSIQALIMNDEPYLNEPGWSSGGGSAASKQYTKNVRRMVVIDAMLGNLRDPPFPFENIIRTHFRLKARAISAQLDQWLKEDDGYSTSVTNMNEGRPGANSLAKDVADLKALLAAP